jgi:hypothetical protein
MYQQVLSYDIAFFVPSTVMPSTLPTNVPRKLFIQNDDNIIVVTYVKRRRPCQQFQIHLM